MDLPLLTNSLAHVNVAPSGPEIMVSLILVIHASKFEIMEKVKDKLSAINLSGFPGENVELYYYHQLGLLQRFSEVGFLQYQQLSCLTCPLTWCTGPAFQLLALNQNKVVSEFRFKTQHMALSLIPEADRLEFEKIIRFAQSKYKQLFDADNCTSSPGSTTTAAKPTLPAGYKAALQTDHMDFHTMICQAISIAVAAAMSASTQATLPPPVRGGGGRGSRVGQGGDTKQVSVPGNCNRYGKSVHDTRDFPKRNTYWDPPLAGNEDTDTRVHHKKG